MTAQTQKIGSSKRQQRISGCLVNGALIFLVIIWLIPTIGLLVSSFRTRFDIQTSGWWTLLPHQEWVTTREFEIPTGLDPDGVMDIEGAQGTFDQFRAGVVSGDGTRLIWIGNKRLGRIQVQQQQWKMNLDFTLENYQQVLGGKSFEIKQPDGSTLTVQGDNFIGAFINSIVVAFPATVIPILIAAFAAYGFAWMRFPGRRLLFIMVVALLVVPLQIALVPILRDYVTLNLNGTFLGIWLAHTGFGLPLATYLLFNYISGLPRDILESAFIDGASHFTIFMRLILPLSVPALASFAIFQFLWTWNDYLVALIFIGAKPDVQVLTMRIAEMVGSRGNDWHLLTAGAFVSMILPLIVFFSLQRYFVRGLLAGSVKG
ncbi:MAG: carbohydrate ABC transporter permease [Anaerolineae bacterium]|jgi:alpha-glucoside transport system permease protein